MNPVHWFEIATTDLDRARDFYAKLFNLEFELVEMAESKMYMFGTPGEPGSSGCLVHAKDSVPSAEGSLVYFSCEDVAEQAALVEDAGGTLVVPKTDIGDFGFFAQIIDTEGNRIGLHSDK